MAKNPEFVEVYEALYDDIWLYCLRRTACPADAEDMLSETFTTVFAKLSQLAPGREIRPWVFSIARNKIRNHRRSGRRRERFRQPISIVPESGLASPAAGPETLALDGSGHLARAFCQLNESEQEIIALASWEELSNAEIATALGCSEIAARSRLHRARRKFSKVLKATQHVVSQGQVGSEYVG